MTATAAIQVKDDVRPDPHFSRDTYDKALIRMQALRLRSFNEYVNQLVIADVMHQAAENIRIIERQKGDVVKICKRKKDLAGVIMDCLKRMDADATKEELLERRGPVYLKLQKLYFREGGTVEPYNIDEVLPKLRAAVDELMYDGDLAPIQVLDGFVDFIHAQQDLWHVKQDTIAVHLTAIELKPPQEKSAVEQFTEGVPITASSGRQVFQPHQPAPVAVSNPEEPLAPSLEFLFNAPPIPKENWASKDKDKA